jgi:hypothetical protein
VDASNLKQATYAGQRRSQRILLIIPVVVSGTRPNGTPFAERAETRVVNAHGALVVLKQAVSLGQKLKLTNISTNQEEACAVMDLNLGRGAEREVGVEFIEPSPYFWHVAFPPVDWTPRSPEAKRFKSPVPVEKK